MRATKQMADTALGSFKKLMTCVPIKLAEHLSGDVKVIEDFILAAARALPNQSAVDRDRIRRKK